MTLLLAPILIGMTGWKMLPRWRPLARASRLPGVTTGLDVGYRLFSPFRPTLARIIGRFT